MKIKINRNGNGVEATLTIAPMDLAEVTRPDLEIEMATNESDIYRKLGWLEALCRRIQTAQQFRRQDHAQVQEATG